MQLEGSRYIYMGTSVGVPCAGNPPFLLNQNLYMASNIKCVQCLLSHAHVQMLGSPHPHPSPAALVLVLGEGGAWRGCLLFGGCGVFGMCRGHECPVRVC